MLLPATAAAARTVGGGGLEGRGAIGRRGVTRQGCPSKRRGRHDACLCSINHGESLCAECCMVPVEILDYFYYYGAGGAWQAYIFLVDLWMRFMAG